MAISKITEFEMLRFLDEGQQAMIEFEISDKKFKHKVKVLEALDNTFCQKCLFVKVCPNEKICTNNVRPDGKDVYFRVVF